MTGTAAPPPLVRSSLRQVLSSRTFRKAGAHQRLLRYLVEHGLAGDTARVKETVLAIEVFQRSAARFDPATDSIVRVEARRLRQRLARFYAGEGTQERIRFELPAGQYVLQVVDLRPTAASASAGADDALELMQRGHFFLQLGHEEGAQKALARFEQAAALSPSLPDAHLGIARAWMHLVGMTFVPPQPAVGLAEQALERALALAPSHGEGLALLAGLRHRFALDWPGARALYQRALAAAPDSARSHHQFAFSLMTVRQFDEAEAALQCSRRLDPANLITRAHEALLLLYRRDYPLAQTRLLALLDMQMQVLPLTLLGYVHLMQQRPDEALDCYDRALALSPQLSIGEIGMALAQAQAGQHNKARDTLAAVQARMHKAGHYFPPYQEALVRLQLGETDAALTLLERAAEEQDPNFVCLPTDPGLDALRAQPRFLRLEQRCGLPAAAP